MKRNKVKMGLIGAGPRGLALARLYAENPAVEICAGADPEEKKLDELSGYLPHSSHKNELRKYTDAESFLSAEKGLDWVIIASPDSTHYGLIMKTLCAGFNVFAEKPMCLETEEAFEICKAVETSGKKLVVGCELRYTAPVMEFKNVLSSGKIGKHLHAYCIDSVGKGFTYFLRYYRWKKYSLGPLMQKGVHSMDLINYFTGAKPVKVYADGGRDLFGKDEKKAGTYCRDCEEKNTCIYSAWKRWKGKILDFEKGDMAKDHCVYGSDTDVDDNSILIVNYDNGMRVSFNEINFTPDYKREYHFIGTEGRASLIMSNDSNSASLSEEGSGKALITIQKNDGETLKITPDGSDESHWGGDKNMRDELVKATLQNIDIKPDAKDGAMAIAVICAAEKSIKSGIPVVIKNFPQE